MVKQLSLKKNMAWTLTGSVIYSFTQWLLLIVIAKIGTPEMVGLYALGLAVTAPIVLLTDLELRLALVTDAKSSFGSHHYLGTRIMSVGLSFIIIMFVVLVVGYEYYTAMIIILIGMAKLPESVSDIYHGLLQKFERMDLITISNIIKGILTVITFSVILYVTDHLILTIIGQIVIWSMILIFLDRSLVKPYASVKASFQLPKIKELVKLTIPLGFMALLTSFNTNIPSYLIEYYLGKEELGYFAALIYIFFAGNRLSNSLRQPTAPRLAKLYQEKNIKGFLKLIYILMILGFFIGILGFLAAFVLGEFLLAIIYTASYTAYSDLFVVIMASGILSYPASFLDTAIIATRHFRFQPYLAAFRVIVSLVACFLLIPKYGVYGAGYALILTSFAKLLSFLFVLFIILKKERMAANSVKGGERVGGY